MSIDPVPTARPTRVRYLVLGVTAATAVFMYIDRVCIAQVKGNIETDLNLTPRQMAWVMSAFFWSYALFQVPAGVLGIKLGHRRVLALYLFSWSFFTAVSGMAAGFAALIGARLAVGLAEAGAYPTAATLVKSWFPLPRRGFANSTVALGGRLGNAFGLLLTPHFVAAFTGSVINNGVPVHGWRITLVLFGVLGMLWSLIFWRTVRDHARIHPWSNTAEAELIGPPPAVATSVAAFPLLLFLRSRNMWAFSMVQFCNNLGWAFLITLFPEYLETVFGKNPSEKGYLSSIPGFVGCVGMFLGGFLTDWLIRRTGVTWGRRTPILIGTLGACVAYLFCSTADTAWAVVIAMCLMTISTDLAIPAVWAISQDIGGKRVGPVLGWGNMWGNIGAAVCPLLMEEMKQGFGWSAVFITAALAYFLSACCSLLLDASRPLENET